MTGFRVKVCGITRPQDAALAAKLGADLIGVIFHSDSPRAVNAKQAARILAEIPPVVQRVGVFVHHPLSEIGALAIGLRLNFVQLHGNQSEKEIRALRDIGIGVIRAFDGSSSGVLKSSADIIMLDNLANGDYGGSGKTFGWQKRPKMNLPNLMLAGGINEQNVEKGVRVFRPLIVDVNSGVESSPGIKSRVRLTRFMQLCDRIRYGK